MTNASANSSRSPSLHLILFVDDRSPNIRRGSQEAFDFLHNRRGEPFFELEIVSVAEHPHLVEHFKLVATPALVKISPSPQEVLVGTDLAVQVERWLHDREEIIYPDTTKENIRSQRGGLSIAQSFDRLNELVQLQEQIFALQRQQDELLEQIRFKDFSIDTLAHELRNPLTAISLNLQTLQIALDPDDSRSQKISPKAIKKSVDRARQQVLAMDSIIQSILISSRGVRTLSIQPKRFKISKSIDVCIDRSLVRFNDKQQTIETDIPPDLPDIYGDDKSIEQLITNLLENAHKYTPANGKIKITALHRTTEKIEISIGDNGLGIPAKDLPKIFEEGVRLERDIHIEGFGLGLNLCQQIVRAHYGHIWVESELNKGSCFYFTLPVYR
jgi:two-component system, OmpR family, clock-associated histidine kinase SasA